MSYFTGTLSAPAFVKTVDINHDDHLDLIFYDTMQTTIGVYIGDGTGLFSELRSFFTNTESLTFALGDFNNDGYLDAVLASFVIDRVVIYLGDGNGSFGPRIIQMISYDVFIAALEVADFNNDGKLDVVISDSNSNTFGILLGKGNGSLETPIVYSTGDSYGLNKLSVGDLNGDHYVDIVFHSRINHSIVVLFGSVNGSFASAMILSLSSESLIDTLLIDDLNGDTIPDIIFSDNGLGDGTIGVYYGRDNGSFAILKNYVIATNAFLFAFRTCDFNNDQQIDLVVSDGKNAVLFILFRNQSEPFSTPIIVSLANSSHPIAIAIADFNQDQHLDMAILNSGTNNIDIFLGNESGYFNMSVTLSTGADSSPNAIITDDFNHDHQPDLAVVNIGTNNLVIFLGDGHGEFLWVSTYSTGVNSLPFSIAVADLNQDEHSDLAVCNSGTNELLVFHGDGYGNFSKPTTYSLGFNARPQSVAIADLNNDKLLDIVVANYGNNYLEILLQNCSPSSSMP